MSRQRCLVLAISGPDGSGKSSLARELAGELGTRGFAVATAYCYGCVLCRRVVPGRSRPHAPAAGRWPWPRRAHALLDATELAVRLAWARLAAGRRAHGRPAAVVTDRGPLDGLAKFGPPPGSLAAALFARISRRYDLVLLLDAPPGVLAARDREHSRGELAAWRDSYRGWARRLPSCARLDTSARPPAAVAAEAAALASNAWAARTRPGPGRAVSEAARAGAGEAAGEHPGQVVISTFDSPANPYYGGGGAAVAERLARWLSRDFQVTVVTAGRRAGTSLRAGVRYRYLPVGWAGPRAGQLLFHLLLPFTARRIPHDLWIESFTPPISTSFLPLFSPAPVVGLAQNLSGEEMSRRYRIPFFLVERLGLRLYHDIVVLNPADRARVRRYSRSATVQVIPNCVEQRPLAGQLPGHGEHILFLGRICVWEKGLDLLLAAYGQSGVAMPLLLAGSGTGAEERKLAVLLAVTGGAVRWLGQATGQHKQDLLERCAFLVLPSRSEAFGLAALEAMSYGRPVIHFDLPTLRWMDGDVRVRPFDVSALAADLRELAGDERKRRELGRAAHATAAHYGPEEAAERYLALVRRLLPPRRVAERPGNDAACR
ncbi:MAG TPA: glycosyltransferase [Streptosporangiaceae bacterium]|nr:glycosyltransferase [Streptosporangiaceae bacterium]